MIALIILILIINNYSNKHQLPNFKKKKKNRVKKQPIKVENKIGISDNVDEEDVDTNEKFNLSIWKKILKIILRDKKPIIIMCVASVILAGTDILFPLFNKYAIESYFSGNPNYDYLWLYLLGYATLAFTMGFTVWLFIRQAAIVEEATTYEIRTKAFKNLQQLSFSYYDKTSSGWVMARMTSDARRLADIISWSVVDLLWGFVLMLGILVVSFFINWRLALIICALIPVFFVLAVFLRKKILREYRSVRKINSAITSSFNESFMGANTTKTLVLEDTNNKEFGILTSKMRRRSVKAGIFSSLFWPSILVLGYFGVATVAVVGGNFVLSDNAKILITTGTLYLFIDYAIKFFDPVMQITRIIADFQQAQASAERIISLIETKPDIEDTTEVVAKYGDLFNHKKENWEPMKGDITFDNVSFKYKGTELYVLKDFSLKIKQGQMVALVGETGSGKSTIVNLICRFYEPTMGKILIDNSDYRERSMSWLHSKIGYVLQTPHLFTGTIYDNIRYGKMDATEDEIMTASKIVNAHEFITKLDKGYQTEVGEGGNMLSIGQKQLISFARAIIGNPELLILDEATSSIDTENEMIIQKAINVVLAGRTSIVVAHRLSTVVNADKIIVLRNGKIIEMGNHRELLRAKGYYFDLYKNQFMQEKETEKINNI